MRADDFLDDLPSSNRADDFLDGKASGLKGATNYKGAPALSFKDQLYAVANKLFQPQSVMDGFTGTSDAPYDPVATAQVDRLINQPRAMALPDAQKPVGIVEKGVRGGVSQLAKTGIGSVRMLADVFGADQVADVAKGAARQANTFGNAPLEKIQIEGFAPNSIVQDLPNAASGAISSIIANAPALAAGVAVPGAGLPLLGAQVVPAEYSDGRDAGLNPVGALLRSIPMAAAEVGGEKLGGFNPITQGIRRAIDEGAVAPVARAMVAGGLRETPSELATTAAQFGIDKLPGIGTNQDATAADLQGQLKDTALQTLIQSGGMVGVGQALSGSKRAEPIATQPATPTDLTALTDLIVQTATIDSALKTGAKPSADTFLDALTEPANEKTAALAPNGSGNENALAATPGSEPVAAPVPAPLTPSQESVQTTASPEQGPEAFAPAGLAGPDNAPRLGNTATNPVLPDAAVGNTQGLASRPPVNEDQTGDVPTSSPKTVRMYHGGEPGDADGPLWFTNDKRNAEGWASKSNGRVWYVDVPADHPLVKADEEYGVLPPANVELPADLAKQRKPLEADMPQQAPADQVPAPFTQPDALDTEAATQLDTAQSGLRPGDIVQADGKPFAKKPDALKHAKSAGQYWRAVKGGGGWVVRHQPPTDKQIANGKRQAKNAATVDVDKDSLFAAIAKLGGIQPDQLTKQWGFDPKEISGVRGAGIKRVSNKNGTTLDRMAERLAELGYLSYDENGRHDLEEFFELFDGELRGNKHYTPTGFQNVAQAMMEEEWLSQQLADELNSLPEEGQEAIEGILDDYETSTEADESALQANAVAGVDREDGQILDESRAEEGNDASADQAVAGETLGADSGQRAGNARPRLGQRGTLRDEIAQGGSLDADPDADIPFDANDSRLKSGNQSAADTARERARKKRLAVQRRYEQDADATERDFALKQIQKELDAELKEAEGINDVPFSRDVRYAGMTVEQVREAIADDIYNHEVDVYATWADVPDYIGLQASKEEGGDVEGFWDMAKNRVALVAENIDSPERARQVARHELIGHYGLENMLMDSMDPSAMDKLVQRVIRAEADGNKVIVELAAQVDRTQPGLSDTRRAKEIMAIMAERNLQNSIAKRVLDAIRVFLKKIGFIKSDITDAKIAELLRDAQRYLAANGRGTLVKPDSAFSRQGEAAVLDLSKSITYQGETVRRALKSEMRRLRNESGDFADQVEDSLTGQDVLDRVAERLGSEDDAQAYLASLGIHGLNTEQGITDLQERAFSRSDAAEDLVDTNSQGNKISHLRVNLENFWQWYGAGKTDDQGRPIVDGHIYTNDQGQKKSVNNVGTWDPKQTSTLYSRATAKDEPDTDDGMKLSDLTASNRDIAGRRSNLLGQKAYDALGEAINPILAKVSLSNDAPVAFKQMLRQFQVDQNRALANAKKVAEVGTETLNAEERILISDIIEKNGKVADMPPEHVAQLAQDIAAALKVQSRELVDLGMATQDRLIEHYLPRAYRNPVLARIVSREQFASWYQKAKLKMNGNRLKSRGLVKEIELSDFAKYKKLGWKPSSMPDGEPVPQGLLDALHNKDTILTQGFKGYPKSTKLIVWRDFTAEERKDMGEIRDGILRYALGYTETQRDIAIGRLFKAIAEHDELSSKVNPGDWVKVPDQKIPGTELKRYGALSGLYVPKYVQQAIERSTQPKGPLLQMYDKALSFWKEGKTVWNPVSHGNNFVSNIFAAYFAGVNPSPKVWRATLKEYRTKGRYYEEAIDNGLFGSEFASREIQELFYPELKDELDLETVTASRMSKVAEFLKKTGKPVAWYRDTMQKAYEFEDQFFKLMLYMDRREAGASIEDAMADTERYVFNYSDVPEGVNTIKRVYSPFFSYTYKAIPMVLHTAMTRPDRLIAPIMLLGGANWLAYAVMGGDEDEERKGMPDYMQGRTAIGTPKAVRMPFNIGERPAFMDMSRRVPLGDLFDMHNQTGGLAVPAPFMPSHPLFTATLAIGFNMDSFTGRDIVKKSDDAWTAAEKRGAWLWKQMAPNAPFVPGSWNFDKLMNGTANAFDTDMMGYTGYTKAGDPIPLGIALLDVAGGTKIRSFDPKRGMDYKKSDLARDIREIQADIKSARRAINNKAMTKEAGDEYIAERDKQLKAAQEQYNKMH